MTLDPDVIFRDHVVLGDSGSGSHKVPKSQVRQLLKANARIAAGNTVHVATLAELNAIAGAHDDQGGFVWDDATSANNGVYRWDAEADPAGWERIAALPQTISTLKNVAGTTNAITAETEASADVSEIKLLILTPAQTNTAGGTTIVLDGGAAEDILTIAGAELGAGHLVLGEATILMRGSSGDLRQLFPSDAAAAASATSAAASAAAAEADKNDAETAATAAAASAAGLNLPSVGSGDARKHLVVADDETGYDLEDEVLKPFYGMIDPRNYALLNRWSLDVSATEPDRDRTLLYEYLIKDLVDAGVWAKLDFLYVFAAHAEQNALYDLVDPARTLPTKNGTPTFTADQGYTGDGSSAFLDLGFARDDLTQFTQDDAHIGFWSLSDVNEAGDVVSAGSSVIINPRDGGDFTARLNSSTATEAAVASSIGHFIANRTGAAAVELYQDGAALTLSSGGTAASSALSSANLEFLRYSGQYTTRQIAALHGGASLTATEVAALYAALIWYLTGVEAI